MSDREVTANRSRRGVLRICRTHEATHDLPRVFGTLHDDDKCGTLRYELNELLVVRLTAVLGVVALGRRNVDRAQLSRDNAQLLVFKTIDDLANEATRDTVGLHNEKGSIHDEAI